MWIIFGLLVLCIPVIIILGLTFQFGGSWLGSSSSGLEIPIAILFFPGWLMKQCGFPKSSLGFGFWLSFPWLLCLARLLAFLSSLVAPFQPKKSRKIQAEQDVEADG